VETIERIRAVRALDHRPEVFETVMQRPARSVFEGDDMVTALRPIEVRTAAADEVPKVAAVLADAFINDPVFTFLRPGRLRQRARLRTMFVVEMEQYVLANGDRVDDVRVRRRGGRAATRRLGDAEVGEGEGDT